MNYYSCSQASPDNKFPHLPNKVFINLAIIGKECVGRANADRFTKGTLHGHPDEILKKKQPIELEAVLEPIDDQNIMKCVFVEGAPGVGKSTFAWELCRRKEEIKSMKNYSLVVLLRLREKRVQDIQKVIDLFYHDNITLRQDVTDEVVACDGKNVLFILDGFDELPANLRKDSFLVELIQGRHLPACTVLVTSRPSATADLLSVCKPLIHKHIEVLGFTKEQIEKYAESMLCQQPVILQDFLKYISNNPAIHGMMYIPLNSAIVLEIYTANRTNAKIIPCTFTQLYTELCLVLLRKYLVEKRDLLADQLSDKLEDLPETISGQLLKLGELAFEGAMKQKITFEELPYSCDHLGFMNVSTELYLGSKSVVYYSFLHLTLQEFLAAYYISKLPGVEQKLMFIETNLILEGAPLTRYLGRSSHLDVLWRFVAGLTEFRDIGWELMFKGTQWKLSLLTYRQIYYSPLLVQFLFEVQSKKKIRTACDTICKKRCPSTSRCNLQHIILAYTPFDCYAVGYCVAASGHEWHFYTFTTGGNEVVEMLGCGLRSVGDVWGYFNVVNLSCNSLTHQAITYLSEFPSKILNQISVLNLSGNELDKFALDCLADTFPHMANLTSLDISDNPGGYDGMVKVFQKLCATKVHTLSVCDITLSLGDIQALSQLITPAASLKNLKIGDVEISPECVTLMVETVLSPSSLERVELWWMHCTTKSASKFKLLENNSNITSLEFIKSYVGLRLAVPYVAEALHKNKSLKTLGIPSRRPDNVSLRQLFLEVDCSGNDVDVKTLSTMLEVNDTLTELEIFTPKLTKDDIYTLSNALQKNKTLERLYLRPNVAEIIDPRIQL